jgi:hypothetical protein
MITLMAFSVKRSNIVFYPSPADPSMLILTQAFSLAVVFGTSSL